MAKLLQQQADVCQRQEVSRPAGRHPLCQHRNPVDRTRGRAVGSRVDDLDKVSVTSSTRSGSSFRSAHSAPSRLCQPSAQGCLDTLYHETQFGKGRPLGPTTPGSVSTPARRPPRPQSACVQNQRRMQAKARAKSAAKQAEQSIESLRRSRIARMRHLYGLGARSDQDVTQELLLDGPATGDHLVPSGHVVASENVRVPDSRHPTAVPEVMDDTVCLALAGGLGSVPENDCSSPLAGDEDAVACLIAWSRDLHVEDLSPKATLASLLQF